MTTNVNFDTKLIRDLAEILDDTNLTDIEIERDDMRIRVSRQVSVAQAASFMPAPVSVGVPASVVANSHAENASVADVSAPAHKPENIVTSPMVGTAYLSPSPGSQTFVEIGQQVKEGETLLIVEAMKTMNHIPAPRSGVVRAILINDAQPVEFGEPLVVIE